MTKLILTSDLTGKIVPRTALLWTAVAVALFLFLGTTSTAHAHADQGKRSESTSQVFTGALNPGHPQDSQEELPTCHHGSLPCSPNYSMSNMDGTIELRSTSTASFSVIIGFPPTSILSIDPPPPK